MLANPTMMIGEPLHPMMDKNHIINVRDGESLYQICLKLRRRLSGVPGFRPYLDEMEEQEADGLTDPVSSLWKCFRSGLPLLAIYNASQPEEGLLEVDANKREDKIGKEAAFLFIKACMQRMEISAQDTFTLSDLYSDNTTGFVKVTKLVNRVLNILDLSGKLYNSVDSEDGPAINGATGKLTRRQHILKELVETERQYVHHLLNLQALKKELEELGVLTGDSIHNIFLNLNNLLDFAQRFLIRIEQHNELPEESQNWGELFIHYRDPFRQYEPFIANQRRCEVTCNREWDKMVAAIRSPLMQQMLANPTILYGFLLKPFQRLTKYPLLLKDLQNQTESEDLQADLGSAIEIIQDVLHQADASIDKETRDDALQDLHERIDDWKALVPSSFGELLLLGTFAILKGDGGSKDTEKEFHIYLFNRILLCCKDVNANKQKAKLIGGSKDKPSSSLRGKPRLHLKGRIFLANVTNIAYSSGNGIYTIQIFWKGDPGVENFQIKFKNDETMRKWHREIEAQKDICIAEASRNGTSSTHLTSLADVQMQNPYYNQDEDEDSSRMSSSTYIAGDGTSYGEFSMSRNASNNSLRSRSATGGSGTSTSTAHTSIGRPPGRYPTQDSNGLPLLNTKIVPSQSQAEYAANSYFSPIEREPTPQSGSTRSSAQSNLAGFHRYGTSANGMAQGEESYRNTAPAMARNAGGSGNPYLANGRGTAGVRPSLPPGAVQSAQQAGISGNRVRSASSPDINPNLVPNRKYGANGEQVPTVPPIPAHVAKSMAPPNRMPKPQVGGLPLRNGGPQNSQQPHGILSGSRPPVANHGYMYDQPYLGHMSERTLSPPLSAPSSDGEPFMPSQLKAKVRFDQNYVSMIIPSNIGFRSLTDRIDAKLARLTSQSIASGSVRLRYQDEDGDLIWIDSDEAVQDALLDWCETHADKVSTGQHPELLLFAHAVNGDIITGG